MRPRGFLHAEGRPDPDRRPATPAASSRRPGVSVRDLPSKRPLRRNAGRVGGAHGAARPAAASASRRWAPPAPRGRQPRRQAGGGHRRHISPGTRGASLRSWHVVHTMLCIVRRLLDRAIGRVAVGREPAACPFSIGFRASGGATLCAARRPPRTLRSVTGKSCTALAAAGEFRSLNNGHADDVRSGVGARGGSTGRPDVAGAKGDVWLRAGRGAGP